MTFENPRRELHHAEEWRGESGAECRQIGQTRLFFHHLLARVPLLILKAAEKVVRGKSRGNGLVHMPDIGIQDVKSAVRRLADTLPDDATWDDVMYRVYVRQAVDAGLQDAAEGRLVDVAEVRRQFGLLE